MKAKVRKLRKSAFIIVRLVEEADERRNEDLEKEIFRVLGSDPISIPWFEKIEKVTVLEGEVVDERKKGV